MCIYWVDPNRFTPAKGLAPRLEKNGTLIKLIHQIESYTLNKNSNSNQVLQISSERSRKLGIGICKPSLLILAFQTARIVRALNLTSTLNPETLWRVFSRPQTPSLASGSWPHSVIRSQFQQSLPEGVSDPILDRGPNIMRFWGSIHQHICHESPSSGSRSIWRKRHVDHVEVIWPDTFYRHSRK